MNKKSIVLLSSGLDSVVSLAISKEEYNITLALTFDYGQKAAKREINSAKKITDFYKIDHKVIKLDWHLTEGETFQKLTIIILIIQV